jgi:hypothetical protein
MITHVIGSLRKADVGWQSADTIKLHFRFGGAQWRGPLYLALYSVTRDNLIRDRSSWRSVRMAMIVSVAAMSLPSTVLLVGTTLEMVSSAPNAGQATGSLVFMFFLPIPGVLGWFIGRGIAWMRY